MTSLKCWNSGVNSNGAAFILSPSVSGFVSRVPGAYAKEVSSSLAPRLAGQFFVSNPASDNLLHHASKALRVRNMTVVITERLLVNVPKQVERLNANVSSVQATLQETPKIFYRVWCERFRLRIRRRD